MIRRTDISMLVSGGVMMAFLAGCDGAVSGPQGSPSPGATTTISGLEIAQRECAACHAIGRDGDSPHVDALEFRKFSRFYPVDHLAEALAEGIYVGHPDMPVFRFEPDEVEALIDYIESIQDPLPT
jgi:mono/diheme cytochrome c family protein